MKAVKVIRRNILAIVCLVVSIMAEKNEQQTETKAKGWYSDWVKSQENPYIMKRVRELGKKISKARGGPIDHEPVGWFKKFLIQRVRGRLFTEALEARKKGEPSAFNLETNIYLAKIWAREFKSWQIYLAKKY
jgi:hypothetical protein